MTTVCCDCGGDVEIPRYSRCADCLLRCRVCRTKVDALGGLQSHHTSYVYNTTIKVCRSCHLRIHNKPGFHDELEPVYSRGRAKEMGLEFRP